MMGMSAERTIFYWSLVLSEDGAPMLGASCRVAPRVLYFATQRKLERWQKGNPLLAQGAAWHMHEISVGACKELVRLAKKKRKEKCGECGR